MFDVHGVKSFIENFVSTNGLEGDFYCLCGSGFLYGSCCKDNLDDVWYLEQKISDALAYIENIISRKSAEECLRKKTDMKNKLYQIFEKYGRLSSCIDPSCSGNSCQSHLFPRNFIGSLQDDGYVFSLEGVNKKLGADSFKMHLWCSSSDEELFDPTDNVGDFSSLFDSIPKVDGKESYDDGLMGELFVKTMSFKVKTVILDQMYYFFGVLIADDSNRQRVWQLCIDHYRLYNNVLSCFDQIFHVRDGKKRVNFPYCVGKSGLVKGGFEIDKIHYQTNIKMYDDLPVFVVNIVKDGDWMYFVGTTTLDNHKNSSLLDSLISQLAVFKEANDYICARDRIQNEFFVDNNLYYLSLEKGFFGNTYIYGEKNNG